MKIRSYTETYLAIMLLVCLPTAGRLAFANAPAPQPSGVVLSVKSDSNRLLPGQRLRLSIALENRGTQPIRLPAATGTEYGNVKVRLYREGSPPRQYVGPGWDGLDVFSKNIEIKPAEAMWLNATILYEVTPERQARHVMADGVTRKVSEVSPYAFDAPGLYRITVLATDPALGGAVESAPLEIRVDQPVGDDAVVWDWLRSHPEAGRFLHTASTAHLSGAGAESTLGALRSLCRDFEGTRYAQQIRRGLELHQAVLRQRGAEAR